MRRSSSRPSFEPRASSGRRGRGLDPPRRVTWLRETGAALPSSAASPLSSLASPPEENPTVSSSAASLRLSLGSPASGKDATVSSSGLPARAAAFTGAPDSATSRSAAAGTTPEWLTNAPEPACAPASGRLAGFVRVGLSEYSLSHTRLVCHGGRSCNVNFRAESTRAGELEDVESGAAPVLAESGPRGRSRQRPVGP